MPTPFSDEPLTAILRAAEKVIATRAPATLVTGTTIFTIIGGPIVIQELVSECITANDTTASTLQWSADGTLGSATTITAASATLASAAAGTLVVVQWLSAATAPAIYANGVGITSAATTANRIIVPAGILTTTIGTGSSTGTWRHYMRYRPIGPNVSVTAAF